MKYIFDLSNGVGVGVGIGIGLGLRNISEGCFKTTKVNKYKSRTVYRAMLGYGIWILNMEYKRGVSQRVLLLLFFQLIDINWLISLHEVNFSIEFYSTYASSLVSLLTPSSLRSFGNLFVRNLLYRSWFSLNISGNDLRPRRHRPPALAGWAGRFRFSAFCRFSGIDGFSGNVDRYFYFLQYKESINKQYKYKIQHTTSTE